MPETLLSQGKLHFERQGAGPPLLLIHGFPFDHRMWQSQLAELRTSFDVIAPDLRGFGDSPLHSGEFSEEPSLLNYAHELIELLDALHIKEQITLCGLSMGGYIAWDFCEVALHRLERLIICSSKASADPKEVVENRHQVAERVMEIGPHFLIEGMLPKVLGKTSLQSRPSVKELTEAMIMKSSPLGIATAQRAMAARVDREDFLPQIAIPTLLVSGEEDPLTPPELMKKMTGKLPNSELKTISSAGHLAPMECPGEFNQIVKAFLQ
ncbi:Alpha/beta fold hydrolase [Planctomycetales bacterium 10988]|nr:Alpha/beta fold hydrolase [Planctomycetales bacterium 10988]